MSPASIFRFAGIALVVVLLTASLGGRAGATFGLRGAGQESPAANPPQNYEGVITDTHCGARHSAGIGDTAGDCTIRCVRAGEQFILVDGESSYQLEGDLSVLKRAAGQRVKILGTLNGRKISVTSIVAP